MPPLRFAGGLVQRHNKLAVGAVKNQIQPPAMQDRRTGRQPEMIAGQFIILPLPNDLGGLGVETGRAVRAEGHIHPTLFNHRRAGGVAVHRHRALLRALDFKHEFVVDHLARLGIETHRPELVTICLRIGKPNLVIPDHRRTPCLARHRGFPDMTLGGHFHRQFGIRMPFALRAAKFIPLRRRSNTDKNQRN